MHLEECLRNSELQSKRSSFLWAQWCFDKAILTKSLNVISSIFPHYSLHESSHSLSIISEIEKILGANIEHLSFIDAWLLLEASYWHDVGMIITNEEKQKIISDPAFIAFLDQMSNTTTDYAEYARVYLSFLQGRAKISVIELERAFTFLLSEYIRKAHPDRSKDFLLNPETIGVQSPDTDLIASRLFVILGDIIVCHGRSFSSVLDLPLENDGLDVGDVAHPRLVACLLRLGDLLDLDDGRHCPTQLLAIGKLPSLSKAHLEKHRSIISKNVSSYSIEIIAKCQTFDSFEAQNDWFSYIEKEVEDQDRYWGNIAPRTYIGKLPTIKSLVCNLDGSISLGKKASRFSLDSNRVYEFLTGKSIYENSLASILEILQNSVDATIDRIWLEDQDSIKSVKDFRDRASKYPILVSVNSTIESDDKVKYQVVIQDSGKGMTLEDIRSILTIASEQGQNRKQTLRQGMPIWMRPSGFFGIGLQSVFSVTDEIVIETKSASDSLYEITIRSTKGKTPSFVVKKKESTKWKFGTSVTLNIIDDAIPNIIYGHTNVIKSLARFDPLKDSILHAKTAQIEEQVIEFAKYCEFEISFNGEKKPCFRNQFTILDTENGIEYAIEFVQQGHINDWQFRGRPFKGNQRFPYFNIRGNIISERADSFLSLSREKIHEEGQNLLEQKISLSLIKMKEDIIRSVKDKAMASFYYYIYNDDIDTTWHELIISGKKIIDVLKDDNYLYLSPDYRDSQIITESDGLFIGNDSGECDLLLHAARKLNFGIQVCDIKKMLVPLTHDEKRTTTKIVYKVKFVNCRGLSFISPEALRFISIEGIDDWRERYWLPCGQSQFTEISIQAENDYRWLSTVLPFNSFFEYGIVLQSTSRPLEEDIPTMVSAIRKHKPSLSDAQIETSLRAFYTEYPYKIRHIHEDLW